MVLPGELALLLGGFLAYEHHVSLAGMLLVAAVAAVAGYLLGYEVGRRFGPALRDGPLGRRIGQARWQRVQEALAARGGQAILVGRFVGLLRALMPTAAGMARMPYRTFLAYTVIGGLIWAPGFVLLGYVAGGSYQRVADLAGQGSLLLLALLILLGAPWSPPPASSPTTPGASRPPPPGSWTAPGSSRCGAATPPNSPSSTAGSGPAEH